MNHAELRSKAYSYFKSRLEEGLKRLSATGPLTEQQKENLEQNLELYQMPNRDFWHLVGSDNAQAELDEFFAGTGIPQEENRKHFPMILDEIRKAKVGLWEAVLNFDRSLGSYDFTEPQSAPVSASRAPANQPQPSQGPSLSEAMEAFLRDQKTTVTARERLSEALAFVRDGDTLVVTKLDRLARSSSHLLEILETLLGKGAARRDHTSQGSA